MKKIKMTLVAAGLCCVALSGYVAYDYATISDAEVFLLKNIEALTQDGIPESNNNGSGKYYYEHLSGQPQKCTLYVYVSASGEVKTSTSNLSLDASWSMSKQEGIKELCPDSGTGCTVYSCKTVD